MAKDKNNMKQEQLRLLLGVQEIHTGNGDNISSLQIQELQMFTSLLRNHSQEEILFFEFPLALGTVVLLCSFLTTVSVFDWKIFSRHSGLYGYG
jgi:hypothetical protein